MLAARQFDRLRGFGGATIEDTIIEALDALEATQFWRQADTYVALAKFTLRRKAS